LAIIQTTAQKVRDRAPMVLYVCVCVDHIIILMCLSHARSLAFRARLAVLINERVAFPGQGRRFVPGRIRHSSIVRAINELTRLYPHSTLSCTRRRRVTSVQLSSISYIWERSSSRFHRRGVFACFDAIRRSEIF
jgi:hypothetical protein